MLTISEQRSLTAQRPLKENLILCTYWGGLSTLFSLGRRLISHIDSSFDQSSFFMTIFPKAQPLMKSFVWGAFLSAYLQASFTVCPTPNRRRVPEMFMNAGIFSSFSTSFLWNEGIPLKQDIDAMMRPFAYLFLGLALRLLAREHFQTTIQH